MYYGFRNEYIIPILEAWCKEAKVKHCAFEYDSDNRTLIVYTDRPGYLIGKAGVLVFKYEQEFKDTEMCGIDQVKFKHIDGAI